MRRTILAVLCFSAAAVGLSAQTRVTESKAAATAETEIRAMLNEQAAAWNRGDVNAFMQWYWKSEKLTFAGSSGVTRGWQPVLERYRKNYPDRAAMGRLTFSDLEITLVGPDAALVLGRWRLERANDRPGGVFTLLLRRLPEGRPAPAGWRIVHDHTSSDATPKTQ
jgi:ketosteroid isomerase-like protein